MPTVLYSFVEFKELQKITDPDDCLWIHGRYLMANGAQSDGEGRHYGPPEDGSELLTLLLEFCKGKLKLAEKKFAETQSYIFEQAHILECGAGPGPAEDAFTDLEKFQAIVVAMREQIASYSKQGGAMNGPSGEEQFNQRRTENSAAASAAINRAREFSI